MPNPLDDLLDAPDNSIMAAASHCGPGEDCSAFTQNLQKNRGIKVPRTAIQQYQASQRVGINDLQPGDHVFFDNNERDTYNTSGKRAGNGFVNHVGVYLGGGKFISDPGNSSDTRTPQDLTGYLHKTGFKFMGGGRFGGGPVGGPVGGGVPQGQNPLDSMIAGTPQVNPLDAMVSPEPPGGALWNQLGQAQQSQTVNGPVDKALQWLQGPKDRPIAGPPLMPGGPGTAAVAGSQAGNVVNDVMHPSMAWAYPQAQPAPTPQLTNSYDAILHPKAGTPWTHDAILKTAQNATDQDMAILQKQLPKDIFNQIDMARQGMDPRTFNTGIDTSGTGLPGAAQANALANAPGTRPVGEKSASTGPNGAGWDLALKGVGKTIVGLGDPGGSFANVSGDPDEFYRTIGRAYLSAVPQAAALAATGGTSSLASVALTPAAFQLFGGVPSDPEGVLESIASIGALHGVHLSLGALKNVLPGLLSKAGDAPAFQAALDKLNLTKPQRTLVEEAAQHFGVDPSAVTPGENGAKPTVRIPGERSREVSGNIPVEDKSPTSAPSQSTNHWTPQQWESARIDPDFRGEFEEARENAAKAQKIIDSPHATPEEQRLAQEVLEKSNKFGKAAQFDMSEETFNRHYGAMNDALVELDQHLSDNFDKGPDEQTRLDRVFGNKPPVDVPSTSTEPTTGLSMASRAEEAAKGTRPEPQSVKGLSNEDAHGLGQQDVRSGKVNGDQLAADLSGENEKFGGGKRRGATPQEYGALLEHSRQLQSDLNGIKLDGSEEAQAQWDSLRTRIDKFDHNLDQIKGASGSSLQALKIGTTLDEGNFAQMRSEVVRKAGNISPEAEAKIKALTDEVNQHKTAREAIEKQLKDAQTAANPESIRQIVEAPKPVDKNPVARQQRVAKIRETRAQALDDYKKALSTVNAGAPIEALYHLGKVAWTFADEGLTVKLPELLDKVKAHIKEQTGKDVSDQDIIDGMHAARPIKTMGEHNAEKAQLLRDVRKLNTDAVTHAETVRTQKAAELDALRKSKATDVAERSANQKAQAAKQAEIDAANKAVQMARRGDIKEAFKDLLKNESNVDPEWLQKQIDAKNKRVADIDVAIKRGDVASLTPKQKVKADLGAKYEEALRNENAARARAKTFVDSQKPTTWGERLKNYARTSMLSGVSTLGNLGAAVAGHVVSAPFEEGLGPVVKNTVGRLGGLADKAGSELRFSGKAELQALKETVFSKQTLKDAWQKLVWGEGSIANEAISKGLAEPHGRGNPILKTEAGIHGAIKTPTQRNAFQREWVKALQEYESQGRNSLDPQTRNDAFLRAYGASQRGLLQNDSVASDLLKRFLNAPKSDLGKGIMKTIVPFAKIPINLAGRTLEYTLGTPYAMVRHLWEASRGTMTEASAQAISRAYKRGGIGLGLAVYAANDPGIEIDKKGKLVIHGFEVPEMATHIPWVEPLLMGAYYRKAGGGLGGAADAQLGAVSNIAGRTPFADVPRQIAKGAGEFYQPENTRVQAGKKAAADLVSGIAVPSLVKQYAAYQDNNRQHSTSGFLQELQKSIPTVGPVPGRSKLPPPKR